MWSSRFWTRGKEGAAAAPTPPASPTLAVVDNADGTGAVATITASTTGSTNAVMTQAVSGSVFASAGSRTGNGTVSLSLGAGYYWAYVQSTKNGVSAQSNVVRFAVTDSALAVYERCHNAVSAVIAGLIMTGTPNAHVFEQLVEDNRLIVTPCVFVTIDGQSETEVSELTGRDDISYPVKIQIVDRNYQDYVTPKAKYLLWRQQIARSLRNQRFATVPENIRNRIEPKIVVDSQLQGQEYFVSGLCCYCICREPRG